MSHETPASAAKRILKDQLGDIVAETVLNRMGATLQTQMDKATEGSMLYVINDALFFFYPVPFDEWDAVWKNLPPVYSAKFFNGVLPIDQKRRATCLHWIKLSDRQMIPPTHVCRPNEVLCAERCESAVCVCKGHGLIVHPGVEEAVEDRRSKTSAAQSLAAASAKRTPAAPAAAPPLTERPRAPWRSSDQDNTEHYVDSWQSIETQLRSEIIVLRVDVLSMYSHQMKVRHDTLFSQVSTRISKLARKNRQDLTGCELFFGGRRIEETDTPELLQLRMHDRIAVRQVFHEVSLPPQLDEVDRSTTTAGGFAREAAIHRANEKLAQSASNRPITGSTRPIEALRASLPANKTIAVDAVAPKKMKTEVKPDPTLEPDLLPERCEVAQPSSVLLPSGLHRDVVTGDDEDSDGIEEEEDEDDPPQQAPQKASSEIEAVTYGGVEKGLLGGDTEVDSLQSTARSVETVTPRMVGRFCTRGAASRAKQNMQNMLNSDARALYAIKEHEVEMLKQCLRASGLGPSEQNEMLTRQREQHDESDLEDGAEMEDDEAYRSIGSR